MGKCIYLTAGSAMCRERLTPMSFWRARSRKKGAVKVFISRSTSAVMVPRAVAQFDLALCRTFILGGEYFLTLPDAGFPSPCA